MAFSRKTTRYYMDEEDLRGALRVLCDRMAAFEAKCDEGVPMGASAVADYWMDVGAAYALEIVAQTDYVENQDRFVKLFDVKKGGQDV